MALADSRRRVVAYLAASCQRPIVFPSESWMYAVKPRSPTGIFGAATFPPDFATQSRVCSMFATLMVTVGVARFFLGASPPFIATTAVTVPFWSDAAVPASQYSWSPHWLTCQPKTLL